MLDMPPCFMHAVHYMNRQKAECVNFACMRICVRYMYIYIHTFDASVRAAVPKAACRVFTNNEAISIEVFFSNS